MTACLSAQSRIVIRCWRICPINRYEDSFAGVMPAPCTTSDIANNETAWRIEAERRGIVSKDSQISIELARKAGGSRMADLEAKATQEALGIKFDPELEESSFEGDKENRSPVNCTHCAERFFELSGEHGLINGWKAGTNPLAEIAKDMGHDSAVVEERYLVDPWGAQVEQTNGRSVYDLSDAEDRKYVLSVYGDPQTWTRRLQHCNQPGGDRLEWERGMPTALQEDTLEPRPWTKT